MFRMFNIYHLQLTSLYLQGWKVFFLYNTPYKNVYNHCNHITETSIGLGIPKENGNMAAYKRSAH